MRRIEISCGAAIAASLLVGGATREGSVSDAAVQLACLPLLASIAPEIGKILTGRGRIAILLGLTLAIPLLQLIPLPPALWSALPGRAAVVETYQSAGLDLPWLGISVSPWATVRVAFSLLPPVAIFLGVLACRWDERRRLLLLILAIGLASVFLDVVQVVQGPGSPLRFYSLTDTMAGVGFFANRNHNAALLYSLIPLAALVFEFAPLWRTGYGVAALLGFFMAVVLGLMMTGSRSAPALGLVSCIFTYALILNGRFAGSARDRMSIYIAIAGVFFMTSLLAPSFGLVHILDRFRGEEIASDARWTVARVSFEAAKALFPFGSGLGTFERVYPLFEPTNTIISAIVNHVHDDLLEIALEAGLPGIFLVGGWFILTIVCAVRNMRENDPSAKKERFAALIVLTLLFVHSFVDYPLRTSALAAIFAFCCAILSTAVGSTTGRESERPRRSEFAHAR